MITVILTRVMAVLKPNGLFAWVGAGAELVDVQQVIISVLQGHPEWKNVHGVVKDSYGEPLGMWIVKG